MHFYKASSSAMFGATSPPQNENTVLHQLRYHAAMAHPYWMVRNFRDAYGIYAVNGILSSRSPDRPWCIDREPGGY